MFSKQIRTVIYRSHNLDRQFSAFSKTRPLSVPLIETDCISYKQKSPQYKHSCCCTGTRKILKPQIFSCRGAVSFTQRTHHCGELTSANIGEQVRLSGWVVYRRMVGLFVIIRDWTGIVQLTIPQEKTTLSKAMSDIPYESVIEVHGTVIPRPEGQENKEMTTGEIEVEVSDIKILNKCRPQLPIDIRDFNKSKEIARIQYRYLDIRRKQMQHNLRLRSSLIMKMREFLSNHHGFVDVETPTLFRRTPGGAQEFVVPSRHHGKFYSLPQSPQQFKQLLMVGGIDKYYQIARCYRDEGSKPDRQPEFTQLDIEMSFTTQMHVQNLIEQLLKFSWPPDKGEITTPFPHMTYDQAMKNYGSDKPDLRFDMKLVTLTDYVEDSGVKLFDDVLQKENGQIIAIRIPEGSKHFSKKEIKALSISPLEEQEKNILMIELKSLDEWKSPISKYMSNTTKQKLVKHMNLKPNDLVAIATGIEYSPYKVLGKLRTDCTDLLEQKGVYLRNKDGYYFLWVTDFPLFLKKEDGDGLESAHHPFTAPHKDDEQLLYTQPEKVRSEHFDLVLNGSEIGGGSIRIHNSEVQRYVLQTILREDVSDLEHLLEALELGCPPHGGIALGLDRLMSILCGANTIRDVIAFPKIQEGNCPMSKAPSVISKEDLDLYHIQVKPLKTSS